MYQKHLLKIIKVLVFAVIVATPLFFLNNTVFPAIISKTAMFQALVEAAFFLWLALIIANKEYRPKFNSIFAGLSVFLAILVFASALGVDPFRSFWSTYERMFGVVTILHLAVFAVIISSVFNARDRRRLMYASVATSFAACVAALVQTRYAGFITPGSTLANGWGMRTGSTLDNPSFLAGYLIFNFFIGVYLLLDKYRNKVDKNGDKVDKSRYSADKYGDGVGKYNIISTLFLFLSIFINGIVVFLTQTRGAILGFGAGIFLLLMLFAISPPNIGGGIFSKRRLYLGVIVLCVLAGCLFWFTRANNFWDNIPGLKRFKDISTSLDSGEFQPRLIALSAAWHGFLEKPVLGWGWENFNIPFNKYYNPKSLEFGYFETRFDKPHNFLAELAVSGGVLLIAGFIILMFFLVKEALRLKDKLFGQMVVVMLAAFIIQNLFLFDTLGPALMFYMVIGLVGGKQKDQRKDVAVAGANKNNYAPGRTSGWLAGIFTLVALVMIYCLNVRTVGAAYYEYWGFQYLANSKVQQGIDYFRNALNEQSPYRYNFVRDYATAMAQAYFYNGDVVPKEEVRWAIGEMEKVKDEHPLDAYNYYILVDMYNQISEIDPSYYLPRAEEEAAVALRLSPNRQEVYFSLAKTKYLEGKNDEAINLVKYALSLDPKVPDAHFYYGLLAFAMGDSDTGYREIEAAIKLGRVWRIFYEPRTVAGFFADSGHLDEAIGLYGTTINMQPGDTETQIKLGAAYFYKGDKEKARYYLLEASRNFDFTKSAAYGQLKPILDDLGIR